MARVFAPVHALRHQSWREALRAMIVFGSAIALIAADRALPYLPF